MQYRQREREGGKDEEKEEAGGGGGGGRRGADCDPYRSGLEAAPLNLISLKRLKGRGVGSKRERERERREMGR